MHIRPYVESDRAGVLQLWHRAGLVRPWNDPDRDIDRKVSDSPWGLLVGVPGDPAESGPPAGAGEPAGAAATPADGGEQVIASMMVGYDGHRGSVYYLAVDPQWRGQGLATALMEHAEALLGDRGCSKVNVSVRADNSQVIGFYADRGYQLEGADHAVTLALRLVDDESTGLVG